ncbi:histidine kinase [Hassallia byssoidea VB512170]|uniref:histidine kinase n=1 Tax=Hassallia byssoidea VB512170 TaxID=1304833 RepID=A0A846HHY0_9CYAN|nr:PAS domain-containing sensor histidine kinase [Hassalia byssoidea]NEU76663.1 histidine kinase [Hassalia byssoidea VB512170]
MLVLVFFLGLAIGIGFWIWQQIQLNRYLRRVVRPFAPDSSKVMLPLIPRLRDEIALVEQHQQDLQQSLQTYEKVLDFAPVGYLQVDEENQLLWCNQQAREILYLQRWQPGQVRLLLELVRSYELDRLIEQTRDRSSCQIKEWVFHPSYENAAAMLELKPLALRASSLPLPNGQVGVFLENRQPLLDMNAARDRAFSDLAHELKTPLTSIRLVVETLQNRLESPLNRWVDRLMQEVDRLISLVHSWLELTQIQNNPGIELHPEVVEVRSLIASVWATLEPIAQQQQLTLDSRGGENLWIKADKSRIYQVFLNLLDNSIKYSPPGTKIYVEAKIIPINNNYEYNSSPQSLEINIIDSGFGFSASDLPYVFERFYRGDTARTRDSQPPSNSKTGIVGTGLGLAIVKQIILAHGGSIKAMNHPETKGAWLQIVFPEVVANSQSQDYS